MRIYAHFLVITLTLLFIFLLNIFLVDDSCIQSPADLAFIYNKRYTTFYIHQGNFRVIFNDSIPDAANIWVTQNKHVGANAESPYKFRVLGTQLALETRHLFGREDGVSFYRSYIFWCFVCILSGLLVLYRCAIIYMPQLIALLSILLFMATPAFMHIFKYPICMTVNDALGFLFVASGFFLILSRQTFLSTAIVSIGMLCRETVLVVSLFGLLFSNLDIHKRLLHVCVPVIFWIIFRCYAGADHKIMGYNPFDGLFVNLAVPFSTLAFGFTVFGVLWWVLCIGFWNVFNGEHRDGNLAPIVRCSFVPFLVIIAFHFICASVQEMRITLLVFAPFAVFVIGAFMSTIPRISIIKKGWIAYGVIVALASIVIYVRTFVHPSLSEYVLLSKSLSTFLVGLPAYYQEQIPVLARSMISQGWAGIGMFHLTCLAIVAPICVVVMRRAERFSLSPEMEKLEAHAK